MIIIDLFDIDFHIFTVIKFLFNLGVRFNYIYALMMMTTTITVMNTSLWEIKSIGSNDIYYMNINPKGNKCI